METKRQVAIYGGAFDPVSLRHEVAMLAVHCKTGMEMWMMPCFGHRFGKEMAPTEHRLKMCLKVTNRLGPWARTSAFEIAEQHDGSTYELMHKLKKKHPDVEFHVVMGMDNFNSLFEKWDRGRELAEENPLIIVGRCGHENSYDFAADPRKQFIDLHWAGEGASSDLRQWIAEGRYDLAQRNLNHLVWQHIRCWGLYGYVEPASEGPDDGAV